ncbi:hypothetical protein JH314_02775 [Xanthomonas campestris]|uniref:DUF6766 family protein n=1 Tax=Xanthomonas campestris TaxID=339 RepID=UPI00138FA897|nr:DUF6766 family protein [Xanthomonas campestris]WDJ02424.1 hypothetical protein JH314_02775 [Xanthomonas campestris]WDJ90361.1 hypothetical protein JH302_02980 [Xanthomonas campestris]WDK03748.1 hypothetical protein JH273_08510 [Xanthomonas campestris]WDK32244.1 hypothetical protein JH307_03025 [Xanthomonas campestris]WVL60342.1 DUF6766 family protein [Xanthomonas campestris pv. barbareae]
MIFRRHGLSLCLLGLTLLFIAAQVYAGLHAYNQELAQLGQATLTLGRYLRSGHFISALFENWESEFLQMGMYVLLTVKLRQVGSAESRPLDPDEETSEIAPGRTPWPVRKGGLWLRLYEHSLAIAFGVLFLLSFVLHLLGSWRLELAERAQQGLPPISLLQHFTDAAFWFESMQNWQSEFLAVFSLVVLTIWLRQKDSPQSKPVAAPHSQTGG